MSDSADSSYRVLRPLGEGASAQVFLVERPGGDLLVLKRISLQVDSRWPVERTRRELEVLRTLDHPNVVRLLALEVHNDVVELFYPYEEGVTLARALGKDKRVPLDLALPILRDILLGLEYLHSRGLVHRDLKPGNIYRTRDGRTVLLDLGLVKDLGADEQLTATGVFVGTPSYAAPEVFRGEPTTQPYDLYCLGLLAHRMFTGAHPYQGPQELSDCAAWHMSSRIPPLVEVQPELPRRLSDLVQQMLEKKPEDRPDASTALRLLDAVGAGGAPRRAEGTAPLAPPPEETTEVLIREPVEAPDVAVAPSQGKVVATSPASTAASPSVRPPGARGRSLVALAWLLVVGVGVGLVTSGAGTGTGAGTGAEATGPAGAPPVENGGEALLEVDLADIQARLDAWTPPTRPDPALDFVGLADDPAIAGLRRRLRGAEPARAKALRESVTRLADEAEAIGFPPVLAPFESGGSLPGGALSGLEAVRATFRLVGEAFPSGVPMDHVALAAARVEEALSIGAPTEETLRRRPTSILGQSGAMLLFSPVLRPDTQGGLWFVLNTAPSASARSALYQAYAPAVRAALVATRQLALAVEAAPEGAPLTATVVWGRLELGRLEAPLLLGLHFVPIEDLLAGVRRSEALLLEAYLYDRWSRILKASQQPREAATQRAFEAARALREPPAEIPQPIRGLAGVLHLWARTRTLMRLGRDQDAIDLLVRSRPSWPGYPRLVLAEFLASLANSLEEAAEDLPGELKDTIREHLKDLDARPDLHGLRLDALDDLGEP